MGPEVPNLGVSSCLLGQRVRFNGEHKRNDWLVDALEADVRFVPVCPEMEMGLGTPRESVRLVRNLGEESARMLGNQTGVDLSALARETAARLVEGLRTAQLDGYVLKKDSPSCGAQRVKVYRGDRENVPPFRDGTGIFAQALLRAFPHLPVTEEGRLADPVQREQFIARVFAHRRLRGLGAGAGELQLFHQRHKFLLLEHDPAGYGALGRAAANSERLDPAEARDRYAALFLRAMSVPATSAKRVNVLQHLFGFLKKLLGPLEKRQVLEAIEDYREGRVPLGVPAGLIQYLAAKFELGYLREQFFFEPYPKRLAMRSRQ